MENTNETAGLLEGEYKPISMWGYFGYELLYIIPVAGFIMVLVNAFGGKNKNVKNFARSYFCGYILLIAIVIFVVLPIVAFYIWMNKTAGGLF